MCGGFDALYNNDIIMFASVSILMRRKTHIRGHLFRQQLSDRILSRILSRKDKTHSSIVASGKRPDENSLRLVAKAFPKKKNTLPRLKSKNPATLQSFI